MIAPLPALPVAGSPMHFDAVPPVVWHLPSLIALNQGHLILKLHTIVVSAERGGPGVCPSVLTAILHTLGVGCSSTAPNNTALVTEGDQAIVGHCC